MASRLISPQTQGELLGLLANRKRDFEECGEDEDQPNKKQHTSLDNPSSAIPDTTDSPDDFEILENPETMSCDDEMPDFDDEPMLVISDDEEDSKTIDGEPEQGPILWSEDKEDFPPCAIYHEDVKQHQARITEFAANLADHLSKIRDKGGDMIRLHAEAVSNLTFPEPKKPVITLMGESGAGKSSLINSILDTPHVAKEGNYGGACTCVITEYTSPFPQQTKKFAAVIEFLDSKQRHTLLTDLLREYIHYHRQKDKDWTDDEIEEYYKQAQSAEVTLLELFRGKTSFNHREELESYAQTIHKNDIEAMVVAQMEIWCEELIAAHVSSSQSSMIEDDRAFQFGKVLNPFVSSSKVKSQEPRLWPIVFKIQVGIRGPRVLNHVVLADCPGLSDINRIRVNASKNYIRSSDHMWVVACFGRCVSNTTVDSILFEFGERFAGRLAIVCTNIDDRMRYSMFVQEYPDAAAEMEKVEKSYKQAKANYSEAKARARGVTKQSTIEERNGHVEKCRRRYEMLVNYRLGFMVRVRNAAIKAQLYQDKSEYLQGGEKGKVFFVSNEHYAWLKGFKDPGNDSFEQLNAHSTGIPILRKYALFIPAREMWSTSMTHIRYSSVAFIKSLSIWAARTKSDSGDKLLDIKEKNTKDIDHAIEVYLEAIKKDTEQTLVRTLRVALPEVAQKGRDFFSNVVSEWHHATIKACIRREGTFVGKSTGPVDWNTKLRQPPVRHLKTMWIDLFEQEIIHSLAAESKIKGNLDILQNDLKEMMEPYGIPMGQFEDFLKAQKHGITRAAEKCREKMDKELRNIKQLTDKDNDVGYFALAMKKAYTETAQICGKGYKNIVLMMLEDFINQRDNDSPFIQMADKASSQVNSDAKRSSKKLKLKCYTIYNGVFNQFGGLMIESEDDDADVNAVKTAFRTYLPQVDAEMTEIVEKLEAIGRDPRSKANPKTTKSDDVKIKQEEQQQDEEGASEAVKVKVEMKQEQQ